MVETKKITMMVVTALALGGVAFAARAPAQAAHAPDAARGAVADQLSAVQLPGDADEVASSLAEE
ncbi:MAG: hypothetical protein LBD97_03700, partial [Bifidobacteriaceae bacterium]|nr:hypothetical protein [Bifidobacteriaceae bacterium]